LDDPRDVVRLEISEALSRRIRVIPVLVEGARMPEEKDLPDDLTGLARRQAVDLRPEHWNDDLGRLLSALGKRWSRPATSAAAVVVIAVVSVVVVLIRPEILPSAPAQPPAKITPGPSSSVTTAPSPQPSLSASRQPSSPNPRGTTTASAVNVIVDMTSLSYKQFTVGGIAYSNDSAHTISFQPGRYSDLGLPGTPWLMIPVTVDGSGKFVYDAQYDYILRGRKTGRLTAHGRAVTVDHSGCSYTAVSLYLTAGTTNPANVAPGPTSVVLPVQSNVQLLANVSQAGAVTVPAIDAGGLAGTGSTIRIICDPVTIDVSKWRYTYVGVQYAGTASASMPAQFRLAPANYVLVLTDGGVAKEFPFQVDASGHVEYGSEYNGVLTGRGTATLGLARRA
jgi:hypothetical protein